MNGNIVHSLVIQVFKDATIREVEVSITAKCNLACQDCGFFVPHQPEPAIGDPVDQVTQNLSTLHRLGVRIGTLVILGGEPTLFRELLARAAREFRATTVAHRIEVVTNGLSPQGLAPAALEAIDRITISDYGYQTLLFERWRTWLARVAPKVELEIRQHTEGWDPWTRKMQVTPERAQEMYSMCWYRKHCTTIERGRIFVCSRIAKLARDEEGLLLNDHTTVADLTAYLDAPRAIRSCEDCTPMMGLPTVTPGVQPDNRIDRLSQRALRWLDAAITDKEGA